MVDDAGGSSPSLPNPSTESLPPKSYAHVISSRSTLSKFNVSRSVIEGKTTVAVPDEIFEDSIPLWEDFLVGRFPSTAPHVAKIHVIVNKIWNLGDKNIRIDVYSINETAVKFRIRHESARLRVLRRGMWNICNLPMIISKWTPILEEAQPEITSMPMWVLIKNVPNSMFTWKGLSFLASPVGEPKRLHYETKLVTNFEEAKVFIEVDLTQELPKTFFFKVKEEEVCVTYEYPWLPPACGICKKWGHDDAGCLASLGRVCSQKKDLQVLEKVQHSASGSGVTEFQEKASSEIVLQSTTQEAAVLEENENQQRELMVPGEINVVENVVEKPVEAEEGEIFGSPLTTKSGDEGLWSKVTNSGGNKSNLVYGQVTIASPTRFEVLREIDDEGTSVKDPVAGSGQQLSDIDAAEAVLPQPQNPILGREGVRVLPTRHSKSAHRILSDQAQKAKDKLSSNLSKKKNKNNH